MPDLTNHVLGAHILRRLGGHPDLGPAYYLGSILPDLIPRTFAILAPATHRWVEALHSPVGIAAVCFAVSGLFHSRIRAGVQVQLLLGAATHLAFDLLQGQVAGGYPLLFPFADLRTRWGPITSDQGPLLLPVTLVLAGLLELRHRTRVD